MIENFIDSALIIDDKENEIVNLKELLESKDIWVRTFTPKALEKHKGCLKNRKIIFLDLSLDDTKTMIENIALIRKHFKNKIGKEFGTYGIILWTKHPEEVSTFKSKIQNDYDKYRLPIFIIDLEKKKYLKNNFNNLYKDINTKLKDDFTADFFITWNIIVNKGKDSAISSVFSLENNYDTRNDNLKYLLLQMALNYSGIPYDKIKGYNLCLDAFRAFSDILLFDINNQRLEKKNYFMDLGNISYSSNLSDDKLCKKFVEKNGTKAKYTVNGILKSTKGKDNDINQINNKINTVLSEINSKLLLEQGNITQNIIFPGNIYEIKKKEKGSKLNEKWPDVSKIILIELTPPCDFSQQKSKHARCIKGGITDYEDTTLKKLDGAYYYKEIYPVNLKNSAKPQLLFFDFRYFSSVDFKELINVKKYKLICRTKDKLFADILQKFSSHAARLGLSIIHN